MTDFEKLGVFYLGKAYDLDARQTRDDLVLYDSSDLVTHAVIIGMTGSGKTGLGIGLLEEAALDGIPALVIDPKGDLGNLMLTFPRLSAEEFEPWVLAEDAARAGVDTRTWAGQQADAWREGLAKWGQDADRVRRFRDVADVAIYTPGSSAGLPISALKAFTAPPPAIEADHELLAERISSSVTGLLTLVGVDADPVTSREHILLATIVGEAWRRQENLDIEALIHRIQQPPFTRVGVLDLDAFYPASDRFQLAMRLNGLLASPGFAAWREGEPIDVDRLLYTAERRPRIAILSIAHLNDAERMFFVSLLLNEVLAWVRRQPGTTSLRALVYMDEVAGYIPPVANPPSKAPLLTLMKQARAFGVGVVLATQNPVDLDYKGLGNAGTWFLGRLQTDRDKQRVLDGLEGALAGQGAMDRGALDRMLSGLGKRVFVLNNVHESGPVMFETRWVLSYLRGPMTRDEIRRLMDGKRPAPAPPVAAAASGAAGPSGEPAAGGAPAVATATAAPAAAPAPVPVRAPSTPTPVVSRPVLPPDVPQFFSAFGASPHRHYLPRLLAVGDVDYADRKLGIDTSESVAVTCAIGDGPVAVAWDEAEPTALELAALLREPVAGATFAPLAAAAQKPKQYAAWTREFTRWLQQRTLAIERDPATGLTARPGESAREFQLRVELARREQRDAQKEAVRRKFAPRAAKLDEQIRRAEAGVAREQQQASAQKAQAGVSVLQGIVGALLGRKTLSATNVGRAGTAYRQYERSKEQAGDVVQANAKVQALHAQRQALEDEMAASLTAVEQSLVGPAELETTSLRPKRGGVHVKALALVWEPGQGSGPIA